MKAFCLIYIVLLFAKCSVANHQTYPGTESRPILSDDEAARYIQDNYLADWQPEEIVIPNEPDYIVTSGDSIQAAVNAAIKTGNPAFRTYIRIEPGVYMETVYVKGNIPLTIYGGGNTSEDVHIMTNLSATLTNSEYKNLVNPNESRYQEEDPAWTLYNFCVNKEDTIGTECSAVFWIESDNFQLQGVTIHNDATDAQAVAIKTSADKLHLMGNRFLGVQDTVGLGIDEIENNKIQRVFVHMCYIEGEMDYVFGEASAVFKMVTFNTTAKKEKDDLVVFAPDTSPDRSFGFLVVESNITGDAVYLGSNKVKLGRSWDHKIKTPEDYVAGQSPNGQLLIRETYIDNVIDVDSPFGQSATSKRPFSSNIKTDRDLDDNTYNRLWEFNNYGDGS